MSVYKTEYKRQFIGLVNLLEDIDDFNTKLTKDLIELKRNHINSEDKVTENEEAENDMYKKLYFKSFNATLGSIKELEQINLTLQLFCCNIIEEQLKLEDMYIDISLELEKRIKNLFKKIIDKSDNTDTDV